MTANLVAEIEQSEQLAPGERWNLRMLLIGQTTSVVGTQTTAVALPLLATGFAGASPLAISLIAAARYLPFLFLSIPAGMLVDRHNPRRLMIASDLVRLALLALLPALYFTGTLSVTVIVAVVLLVTAARVLFDLSLDNHIIGNFDKRSWLTVNARLDAYTEAGGLTGPPLAGIVAGALGAAWALVVDALSYVVSLATLFRLRPVDLAQGLGEPAAAAAPSAPARPAAAKLSTPAAIGLLWRHEVLRYIVAGGAVSNFALMTLQGISVVYMVRALHFGSLLTGLVVASSGIGSAAGAACAPRLLKRCSLRVLVLTGGPASALGPLSLLLPHASAAVPLLGYAVMGASIALISVCGRRYRQGQIPADVFGVVSGVYKTAAMGMLPLGAVTGGVVSTYVGFGAVLWISAAGFLLGAASFFQALRSGFKTQL